MYKDNSYLYMELRASLYQYLLSCLYRDTTLYHLLCLEIRIMWWTAELHCKIIEYLSKTFTSKEMWSLFSQAMFPGCPVQPMRNRGYAEVCCLESGIGCQCLQKEVFHFPKALIPTSKALNEKIKLISWDLFLHRFNFVWGSGGFLCFPALLIIRGSCFENKAKQTNKKKKARQKSPWLQGSRKCCHDLWNEFFFPHLFRMNYSRTNWTKKIQRLWSQIKYLILASQA